ncbi:hypothetical protein QTN25_005979 [Entamoeba marina]
MSTDIFASLDIKKATKKQTINVTPNAFSNTSILFSNTNSNEPKHPPQSNSADPFSFLTTPPTTNSTSPKPADSPILDILNSPSNPHSPAPSPKIKSTSNNSSFYDFLGKESSTPKTPTTTPANVGITTNATDSDNTNVNIFHQKNSPKISSHDLFSPASPSKISSANDFFDSIGKQHDNDSHSDVIESGTPHTPGNTTDDILSPFSNHSPLIGNDNAESSDSSSQQFNFNEQTNFNQTENEQSKSNANDLQDFFNISPNQKEQSDSQKKQTTNSIDAALGFDGQTEQKKEEVQMINGKCESLTIDLVNAWAFEKGTTQRKNLRSLLRNLDEILWTDSVVLIHPDKNQARDQDQLECAQLLFDHVRMSYNIFRKQEMK